MHCRATLVLLLGLPLGAVAHPAHDHVGPGATHETHDAQRSTSPWWPKDHSADATDPQWLQTLLHKPPRAHPTELLAEVAAGAHHLLLARALAHASRDQGRLRLTTLQIVEDYSGESTPAASIDEQVTMAEIAGALRQAALPVGQPLLLLLDPAPDYSYLQGHGDHLLMRRHPAMGHFVLDRPEQAASAAFWLTLPSDASATTLRLALLGVIADGHRLLSRHALSALHQQQRPERLSVEERDAIRGIMQRQELPARLDLADLLASWLLPETAELIEVAADAPPAASARLWRARHRLGVGPSASQARQLLSEGEDAEARGAAAWLLAMEGSQDSRAKLTQLLHSETDLSARLAMVEALGLLPPGNAEALLAIAFDSPSSRLRHATARQLLKLPAERNVRLLSALILDGTHPAARQHAARLLVTRIGTADARAQMLAYVSEDTELRRILSDGLVRKDVLHLHGEGHSHGLLPAKATDRQWQGLAVELRKRSSDAQR